MLARSRRTAETASELRYTEHPEEYAGQVWNSIKPLQSMPNAKTLSAKVLVPSGKWAYQIDSNNTSQFQHPFTGISSYP